MKTFEQFKEQMVAPSGQIIKGFPPLDLRTKDQKMKVLKQKGEFYKTHNLYPRS